MTSKPRKKIAKKHRTSAAVAETISATTGADDPFPGVMGKARTKAFQDAAIAARKAQVKDAASETWYVVKQDDTYNLTQRKPKKDSGVKVISTHGDQTSANRESRRLISARQAERAHKAYPAKMSAAEFKLIAEAIRTLPVSYGDVVINHFSEFMATTNPNFDADTFTAAVKRGE